MAGTSPFLGEIKFWAGNFPPRGYMLAAGQILPIQQFSALFSLLGTNFGGNGTSNFQLPNFQSRTPLGTGTGPGLATYIIGEEFGTEVVGLNSFSTPSHAHDLITYTGSNGRVATPQTGFGLSTPVTSRATRVGATIDTSFSPAMVTNTGGGVPHENRQPSLTLTAIIATAGIFPQRS